jgi:hypothetical protein
MSSFQICFRHNKNGWFALCQLDIKCNTILVHLPTFVSLVGTGCKRTIVDCGFSVCRSCFCCRFISALFGEMKSR